MDAHTRAAWQTQVAAAKQSPGLLPQLVQQRQELLPHFATVYHQLCALPRRVRRKRPMIGVIDGGKRGQNGTGLAAKCGFQGSGVLDGENRAGTE